MKSPSENTSQVSAAEPELRQFELQVDAESREQLGNKLSEMFDFDTTPPVTNWDRNLSYPREGYDYSYHNNLYRQLLNGETLTLSWIQTMDLALVAEELGLNSLEERLADFANDFSET